MSITPTILKVLSCTSIQTFCDNYSNEQPEYWPQPSVRFLHFIRIQLLNNGKSQWIKATIATTTPKINPIIIPSTKNFLYFWIRLIICKLILLSINTLSTHCSTHLLSVCLAAVCRGVIILSNIRRYINATLLTLKKKKI